MKIGSLFSGYGGLDIAVEHHFGAETVWHAEFEDAPSKVLAAHWPGVPNHHDVSTVDWSAVEPVDIITGGFPCQDVSLAGRRAGMTEGTRSNLWGAMRTAIETIRPQYAVIENVRGLLSATANSDLESCPGCVGDTEHREHTMRALGRVLGDLVDIGFNAEWYGLRAADIGAPHGRFRVFILATDTEYDGQSAGPQRGSDGTTAQERARAGRIEEIHDGQPAGGHPVDGRSGHLQRPEALTDSSGTGYYRRAVEPQERVASSSHSGPDNSSTTRDTERDGSETAWGAYEPAIRRWETITGRPAPRPTEPTGRDGKPQLSAKFTEWMMGLNEGHVTGIDGISRSDQLKMLGNGVVPQQALAALQVMTGRMHHVEAALVV